MSAPERLDHRILGPFEVRRDGTPLALGGPRQRAVLAILALAPNTPVSADALVDRLWGDDPPVTATATLQAYISGLRRALEPDRAPRAAPEVLLSGPGGYTLVVPPGASEERFFAEAAATVARRLLGDGPVS